MKSRLDDECRVPVMRRDGAVGWRDVALDGLTCYHRCVEAILRGHGCTADEVTDELGGAVTDRLGSDGKPFLRLRGSTARWLIADPGHDNWAVVQERLDHGRPVVIWPDGFYWPGDHFQGRRHAHHHAIVAVGIEAGALRYLDIDADEADGYAAAVPVTAQTRQACTRVLDITAVARSPALRAGDARRMIRASVRPLAKFADSGYALAAWWSADPARPLVRAADLWVLGDVQPQVYLLARIARRFGHDELADRGFAAAAQAKKISLFLYGLRGLKPRPPYDLCHDDIVRLADQLAAVARAASGTAGAPDPAAAPGRPADVWLWHRLDALARWHFGTGIGARRHIPPVYPARAG